MSVADRRVREKQAVREKILAAARELFAREGFDNVSMRRIAEAIEYSPTAIYLHFQDKEALFQELARIDFASLRKAFDRIVQVKDPIERLVQCGRTYIHFALKHPNHYQLMFMTRRECHAGLDEHHGDPDRDAYAFLRWMAQEAVETGQLRPEFEHPELLAQTVWAAVHGVASLQIIKANDPWVQWRPIRQRTDAMVETIIRGMLKAPREARS